MLWENSYTSILHSFELNFHYTFLCQNSPQQPRVVFVESVNGPVLALSALELAVESAGTGPSRSGCRRSADLTVQSQIDGGSDAALLQIDSLRAPLVAQIRRHQQRAGERVLQTDKLSINTSHISRCRLEVVLVILPCSLVWTPPAGSF